ncbi:MAG: Ni/Fe hydrogenase subunit alpha [Chloroflexi bacterium]|nr:Ni/Fe hydrogenase subunit alpha [Chloroflexota bacterium]MCL5107694.1 Ni/Fe hydrogenase subunit alpha [Chloroflexota bacterium]
MGSKITIEPVTRIEGHAKVTIHVDDAGKVTQARMHVNEFRGFEKFCEGRMFFEMPQITPRICGICPVSHHLTAAKACDAVLGVTIPRPAALIRELMHMGQYIQSHSMHFFHLAGPDLVFGFDAPPEQRNVLGIVQANPELAMKAVWLRKFGQEIIAKTAGRRIHGNGAVPGGVNKVITPSEREEMLKGIPTALSHLSEGIAIIRAWAEANQSTVEEFANFDSGYLGLVQPDGALELYDGRLRLVGKKGEVLEEQRDPADYLSFIGEKVEPWSYLKFPFYKALGYPEGSYRVGPLARLNVASRITTPQAHQEWERYRSVKHGEPITGSLYYHYARLIEAVYAVERAEQILADPDILSNDLLAESDHYNEQGVGCIEAPRGTLLHHYWVDRDGKLTGVNLIVATGHNNISMNRAVQSVAERYVDGSHLTEGMLNRVEAAIRCYDPCLSCSTHAIGRMPLAVELHGPNGLLQRVER